MPSASTKPDLRTSQEGGEPLKQVLLVVEKKVRNLEKRKVRIFGEFRPFRGKKQRLKRGGLNLGDETFFLPFVVGSGF